jgi:hypothetical protein
VSRNKAEPPFGERDLNLKKIVHRAQPPLGKQLYRADYIKCLSAFSYFPVPRLSLNGITQRVLFEQAVSGVCTIYENRARSSVFLLSAISYQL